MVYIVMGVSGSGKTSVGRELAQRLGLPFHDGDDFHPPANKAKMAARIPLDDSDRVPWLEHMHRLMTQWEEGGGAVLACSALKKKYRDILRGSPPRRTIRFIYLHTTPEEIARRLQQRQGHFFPKELLDSQFITLEKPKNAVWIEVKGLSNREIVDRAAEACQ